MNYLRALVTGVAVFIGSHLVAALMEQGVEVVVLDSLSNRRLENLAKRLRDPRFTFVKGDLLEPSNIEDVIKGCDAVFHLAARWNPEQWC